MGNETRRSVASAEWLGVNACLMGGGIEKPMIPRAILRQQPSLTLLQRRIPVRHLLQ